MRGMWDVFCRVIDNHGDLGVCVRLARQLADRGELVRLWVDEASALTWMAPDLAQCRLHGVQWHPWGQASEPGVLAGLAPSEVWIEAFGCELPEAFVAHGVAQAQSLGRPQPAWINLEYLSAEAFVERAHGLPSPVQSGPARGWVKRFFYPGFTRQAGGLLREVDLQDQQRHFDRIAWRSNHAHPGAQRLISLFCYEPPGLGDVWRQLGPNDHLLVTPGRAWAALQALRQVGGAQPSWQVLPATDQAGFDRMLWACDLNFVRGEDSLVRALWSGLPLVWHIYPQEDAAHHDKLEAFLAWLDAPSSLRRAHRVWNGIEAGPMPSLGGPMLAEWAACIDAARRRLWAQDDLLTQLMTMAGR